MSTCLQLVACHWGLSFPDSDRTNTVMLERRSLKAPITLGVVMILLVVGLTAMWVLQGILSANGTLESSTIFWIMLTTGTILLAAVLAGVIAYLTLTVKAFNLNRRQSNFIDAVTHELKSPIASLKLYLQTMTKHSVDQQQVQDFHRFMLEDVERLDALINHLLDAARIDAVEVERRRDSDINQLVELDHLLLTCASWACQRHTLPPETVQVNAPSMMIDAPAVQLEILFRNLIDNAVKYGGSPPQVEIQAREIDDNRVMVSVADNGLGIPANQRRKIFGRFIRLGNELERKKPGTGLGLYLVRNIVKTMGGTIRILSRQNQNSGTEFQVTLPGVNRASAYSGR